MRKMLSKIITYLMLIQLYTSHSALEPSTQPEIYSHSFYREDEPISYTYSAVHTYTTPQTVENHQQESYYQRLYKLNPIYEHGIQYAPIPAKQENQLHIKSEPIERINSGINRRDHLEPRMIPDQEHHPHMSYIPGKNIEMRPSINSYLGSNSFYQSYTVDDKKKANNQLQYINYEQPNRNKIQTLITENSNADVPSTLEVPKSESLVTTTSRYAQENNTKVSYKTLVAKENETQLIPVMFKSPKYLNVARNYNIAQLPYKAPFDVDDMFGRVGTHTQASVFDKILLSRQAYAPIRRTQLRAPTEFIKNSYLQPVKSKKHH